MPRVSRALIGLAGSLLALSSAVTLSAQNNPAMPGFDRAGSDERAIAIADEVMAALGGYPNWDATRYVTWSFFGRRTHVWDKHTGNLRFDSEEMLVLMNLNSLTGRVFKGGTEVTDDAERAEALERAHGAWINDSYWMFMPFKLKDSGVTLEYLGDGQTQAGAEADVLQLTFHDVGRTPQNKYRVYVDKQSRLVTQWDYYPKAEDPAPQFQIPWNQWQRHGRILLSADRGERQHQNVAVFDELPDSVFTDPAPVDVMRFAK